MPRYLFSKFKGLFSFPKELFVRQNNFCLRALRKKLESVPDRSASEMLRNAERSEIFDDGSEGSDLFAKSQLCS